MAGAHRDTDTRNCGAKTIVSGQSSVFVNGKLWAVENDQEDHIHGELISVSVGTVLINGKKVIILTDQALADDVGHTPPLTYPQESSGNVKAYT